MEITDVVNHVVELSANGNANSLKVFENIRVTLEKDYPNSEPTMKWDGGGIAAPGNLTIVSAQAKAGKTAFVSNLIAGSISPDGDVDLFSRIEIAPNNSARAVVHFDTEQAEADQQYNVRTICKRVGVTTTPKNFLSYNIRQLPMDEYRQVTDSICDAASAEFGGIHSIYIDGAADYIKDVNNAEQATDIREYFTHLAIKHQCPVILVIHKNPGSSKERGHLGSEIQRKCYGIIDITKENDISVAKNSFSRKAGDLQPIYFAYSVDKGYHIEVDAPTGSDSTQARLKIIQKVIEEAMPPLTAYGHNDAVRVIMAKSGRSEKTAKDYLKTGLANRWVERGDDGKYRRGVIQGSSG